MNDLPEQDATSGNSFDCFLPLYVRTHLGEVVVARLASMGLLPRLEFRKHELEDL